MRGLEARVQAKFVVGFSTDTTFCVLADSFFKEVRFSLETNGDHPGKGVGDFVVFRLGECDKEAVGTELDVLDHEVGVETDQGDGEGVFYEC